MLEIPLPKHECDACNHVAEECYCVLCLEQRIEKERQQAYDQGFENALDKYGK